MKFVSAMSNTEIITLKELMKNGSKYFLRKRAHILLLSHKGFSIPQIVEIMDYHRDSISGLINRWETIGLAGLYNRPGQGRPKKLNEEEEIDILMRVYEEPRTLKKILADVSKEINKKISLSTIKRIIKLFGLCWKRVKKSLRSKRNENDFQKAKIEIIDLIHRAQSGEIDLYYYDESSFSLNSYIPYAWQPKCYNIEVSTQRSQGLNVLGFMPYDGKNVISFVFEQSINSSVVIECFDYFSKSLSKETILILDNAPTHKSKKFEEKIQEWESKGLHLKFLPPYSPELNKIEILWRFIKYRWIDLMSYSSFDILKNDIFNILSLFGKKYRINFG